uniref:alpha/beta fold hydrolase n=1 Tax=Pararhizobium sp. IMCC3301 TaxID=3067904 RepID=UPI002741CBA7|nr:alpha/beta hydrolase [Pararhizobium sp. IMCC3301]
MTILKFVIFSVVVLALVLTAYTYAASRWLERLYPPLGSFIQVAGQKLHYLSKGEGQSIVLLHGANASLQDFKASLFDPLAKDYRVIAFDRPGYGYSTRSFEQWSDPEVQADLIHQALVKLNVENPVLVGHSWAGSVVMAYLLKYPDAVAGGVLLAGATHPWEGGVSSNVQLAGVSVVGKLFTSTLVMPVGQMVFDTVVKAVFAPEQPTDDYRTRTGAVLALRPAAFQASTEDVRNLSSFLDGQSKRYGEIAKPLLLVTAENDTIVPAWNHAERVVLQVPQAELIELPGAGHALHHTRTDTVVQLIRDFVAKHTAE